MSDVTRARWALIDFRKQRGLTQRGLGLVLGAHHSVINRVEHCTMEPAAKMLARFAEVFQLDAGVVFAESERPDEPRGQRNTATARRTRTSYTDGTLATVANDEKAVG